VILESVDFIGFVMCEDFWYFWLF